eukprot:108784-Hanusia_phi.AAC.1
MSDPFEYLSLLSDDDSTSLDPFLLLPIDPVDLASPSSCSLSAHGTDTCLASCLPIPPDLPPLYSLEPPPSPPATSPYQSPPGVTKL